MEASETENHDEVRHYLSPEEPQMQLGRAGAHLTATRANHVYRVRGYLGPVQSVEDVTANEWERTEPQSSDSLKTWFGITAGALAGVLIVLVAFLMLQAQRNPAQPGA